MIRHDAVAQHTVVGVLLAAGAGRRMGGPKALLRDRDGTSWLVRSLHALQDGGCDDVLVVLGCRHESAAALLDGESATVIVSNDWAEGMGASLRCGLLRATQTAAQLALVSLVDLPDVGPAVVRRVLGSTSGGAGSLSRAAYQGVPGHPVALGRAHWAGVLGAAVGDRGARDYLAQNEVDLVECGDLARGVDIDHRRNLS
ncbi:nucleotidyltransferase family protein [Leekyejoonella antrihumi]|uniref:Nucleotidyltransferase family protein n=1 Tax=Leekyejoonella antrihumi TaxID=1660198 RepID=A0A563E2L4_9MICO|nr:nucleotidyltransferase family protein [Leekyejoonella antrihumi]TWP36777.1 nucleotidyltransferase family protein [Leekyejoonella antrihumi]